MIDQANIPPSRDLNDASAPPLLNYGRPAAGERGRQISAAIAGAFFGVVPVAISGLMVGMSHFEIHPVTTRPAHTHWAVYAVITYALLAALAIFGAISLFRRRRRWFLAGLLLGVGLCSLFNGVCFVKA